MALGHGKYGDIADQICDRFKALGVIIVIIEGNQGSGIELSGSAVVHELMPDFLECVAKEDPAYFLTVALAPDIGLDEVQDVVHAVRMLKGVMTVGLNVNNPVDFAAYERARLTLKRKLWNVLDGIEMGDRDKIPGT